MQLFHHSLCRREAAERTVNMEKKLCRFLALVLALAVVFSLTGCASGDYKKAVSAFERGDYAEAGEMFRTLGDYEDSAKKLTECDYQMALAALYDEKYEEAAAAFGQLGDYKDSEKRRNEANTEIVKQAVLGEWICEDVDNTAVIKASIAYQLSSLGILTEEEFFEYFPISDFVITQTIEFTDLGGCTVSITEESCEKAMEELDETLRAGFSEFVVKILTRELEAQGLTFDQVASFYGSGDLNELFLAVTGMELDEMYDMAFGPIAQMGVEDFTTRGSYAVEDGRIILHENGGSEIAELDMEADTLILTGEGVDTGDVSEELAEAIMDAYPQVYTRW